jgi:pimeloyl-ACP methyl ester carboxylesterase
MPDIVHNFIENDGVRLCLEQRGSGSRHVLFAHGWISSRRMWYDVAQRLDMQKYTLHLLDFRGCGLSDRPAEGYDLAGWASDLRKALAVIPAAVTLVAHSMGARMAQFLAAERPANLERLILAAPRSATASAPNPKQHALAAAAFGSRSKIEAFQRAAMGRSVPDETMERIIDDALICAREAWFTWFDAGVSEDFTDRLARISVPSLAIAGARDPLASPSRIKREVHDAIPNCVFLIMREAGHNLPVERPDEIASAIDLFATEDS